MKKLWVYETSIGPIGIAEDGKGITNTFIAEERTAKLMEEMVREKTHLIEKAVMQLEEYLAGVRREFDLPLHLQGTEFQKKVWQALCSIPYGETRSYQQIAAMVGNEKACRAVGMANNRNPVMILVPCHRVIGKNGKLVGYAGGLDMKEALLRLESENHG